MLNIDKQSIKKRRWILDRFLDRFLMALGVDFGVILTPKIDQKSMLKFDNCSDGFWEGYGAAQADLSTFEWIVGKTLGAKLAPRSIVGRFWGQFWGHFLVIFLIKIRSFFESFF